MKISIKQFALISTAYLGILFAIPGSSDLNLARPSRTTSSYAEAKYTEAKLAAIVASTKAAAPKTEIQAEIIPAATFAVGTSLSSGPDGKNYGVGLTANDISNSWATCTSTCTLDFVFFIFSNLNEPAKVQFKMLSPSNATVFQYNWSSKLVATNWYTVYAKAIYKTAGTYFAEVYVSGQLSGWAP